MRRFYSHIRWPTVRRVHSFIGHFQPALLSRQDNMQTDLPEIRSGIYKTRFQLRGNSFQERRQIKYLHHVAVRRLMHLRNLKCDVRFVDS